MSKYYRQLDTVDTVDRYIVLSVNTLSVAASQHPFSPSHCLFPLTAPQRLPAHA